MEAEAVEDTEVAFQHQAMMVYQHQVEDLVDAVVAQEIMVQMVHWEEIAFKLQVQVLLDLEQAEE
jgi:hypothetical protein